MSGTLSEFEHRNWLGTERMQTSYNGVQAGTFASLPFGDGYCDDVVHFASLDHDTSYDEHAQFREYSNMAGRWFSPDPYAGSYDPTNPQSFNRYAYALNNPLSFLDPSGLIECLVTGGGTWSITAGGDTSGGTDPIEMECFNDDPASGVTVGGGGGGGANGPGLQTLPNLPTTRVPNNITCTTVLPNGRTVGSYVSALSNQINNSGSQTISTPYGPAPVYSPGLSPLSIPGAVFSGTNFRQMFGGPGADYAFLGDAGNFAYAAVSANIGVPFQITEAVAGVYSMWAHPSSDWVGPYNMDPSATVQVPAGYSAACKNP